MTNSKGQFQYRDNEAVTFSVGGLVLGTAKGAPKLDVSQLVDRVIGANDGTEKLRDPWVTDLAIFFQTLDQDGEGSLPGEEQTP
jgi:uncharacterized protein